MERSLNGLTTLIAFTVVTAILYFAQVVFIPIALAALLTFLLTPLVVRLQRWHFPKAVAILLTVVFTFVLVGLVGWLVTRQVIGLAEQLPRYEQTLHTKMQQLRWAQRPGALGRAGALVQSLKKDLQDAPAAAVPPVADAQVVRVEPVPVEVQASRPDALQALQRLVGPFVGPLGTVGVVALFVVAMLFQREDLRERFIQLVSGGQLNKATEAIDEAARRISRYLVMQLIVNGTYGFPIGIGLYFIGIPNAFLWGLLATLLRFIPFLGPWIAASFPVVLAFAVDPGWLKLMMTIGLFLVVELFSNNVIEVWLYGASTGISSVALMVAAVFWTWLWGLVGLFLSTPLTVCLIVMGKYVPGLSFLSVLLGSAPVLEPHARLYQRMLAMDYEEMLTLALAYLKEHDLLSFYDEVLIPALNAAEADRHAGSLAEVRQRSILQNTHELIEELNEAHRHSATAISSLDALGRVLVVPAKDDVDEIAATILVQVLAHAGISSTLLSATALPGECSDLVKRDGIEAVCISAVPPATLSAARQLCRRLSDQCADIKTVVGVWSPTAAASDLSIRLSSAAPHSVVTTMREALRQIHRLVDVPISEPMLSAPIPEDERERLQEVERLHLLDAEPDEMFDVVTRELARIFHVPISLVSIIDADRQFWKSHVGLPVDLAESRESPRETSVCGHVVAANQPLVIPDVTKDRRFANNPFLVGRGIRFYAGVPLRTYSGQAVGSLCVIDTKPRQMSERELALLRLLAEHLMDAVQRRESSVTSECGGAAPSLPTMI